MDDINHDSFFNEFGTKVGSKTNKSRAHIVNPALSLVSSKYYRKEKDLFSSFKKPF